MINEYFLSEYKSYLSTEFRRNKHFKPGEKITDRDHQPPIKSFEMPLSPPDDAIQKDKSSEIIIEKADDDSFVNYWLNHKIIDSNVDANDGHCHIASDIKCADN